MLRITNVQIMDAEKRAESLRAEIQQVDKDLDELRREGPKAYMKGKNLDMLTRELAEKQSRKQFIEEALPFAESVIQQMRADQEAFDLGIKKAKKRVAEIEKEQFQAIADYIKSLYGAWEAGLKIAITNIEGVDLEGKYQNELSVPYASFRSAHLFFVEKELRQLAQRHPAEFAKSGVPGVAERSAAADQYNLGMSTLAS